MTRALHLAWRYVTYHKFKSIVLVLCITLTTVLPIALALLLASFNRQIVARAQSTPLVVGAKGSRLDLVMHALYFQIQAPGTITLNEAQSISDLGLAIPLHARLTAQKVPVVGTTLDYFEMRSLRLAQGTGLTRLGDCVLGSHVAQRLKLASGGALLTDRKNILDIASDYPLKMRITGVLAPTRTADDNAVFVDIKTAWIAEGLGHGHQDLANEYDEDKVMGRDGNTVVARASVLPYTEITEDNIESFHFHGDNNEFPITAMIVDARDDKSITQLLGRFQRRDATAQMSVPLDEINNLLSLMFRVQKFFNANAILIGLSTLLLLVLVILLSIRLRQSEMETMFKIGCRRRTMASLIASELMIIFLGSAVLVIVIAGLVSMNATEIVQNLLDSGQRPAG